MSQERKQELINRYNELVDKYNATKSMSLKGYYAGEMAAIEVVLSSGKKEWINMLLSFFRSNIHISGNFLSFFRNVNKKTMGPNFFESTVVLKVTYTTKRYLQNY